MTTVTAVRDIGAQYPQSVRRGQEVPIPANAESLLAATGSNVSGMGKSGQQISTNFGDQVVGGVASGRPAALGTLAASVRWVECRRGLCMS
ncbi:hypothetical protein Q4I28_002948 [Leishmania naiffi]|uniref:Uncharacterized protein n=1 Tax=Leishmania naiffi TaxID=5678 RepID=A0AAW3BWF3_9TRYP